MDGSGSAYRSTLEVLTAAAAERDGGEATSNLGRAGRCCTCGD